MTIDQIKQRLTITGVLSHYRLTPTGKGALQCPFHEAKGRKKTMQIYTDTNRFQCFHKDCSAGNGDVIDFIRLMETRLRQGSAGGHCSKHEAIMQAKALAAPFGETTPVSADTHDARSDADRASAGSHPAGPDHRAGAGGKATFTTENPASATLWTENPTYSNRVPPKASAVTQLSVENPEQLRYTDATLRITVLGGIKPDGLDRMRVTLKLTSAAHPSAPGLRHTLDLYNDDHLQKLVRRTAERLELGSSRIEKALYDLTDKLENYRLEELAKQREKTPSEHPLTEEEREEAIAFLQRDNLMERTNTLLGESGITGESINRQILWLVYGSRRRPRPLHVICLGASGTGKTYLQEKVARFVPESEKFTFTASTENAFYYLEPYDLCHKLVLIEDMDGVQYLLYPLRELQTKQWISKIVPVKDLNGQMNTRKLEVYGPICLSGTTTKEKLYEDNANRCLLLHLDNSAEQQEAIMDYQRRLSAGKVDRYKEQQATRQLQNLQRVLEPVRVINPYAESLKIPAQCFKPLRTNEHYLQFIETVTWYHQYQRREKADPDTGEVFIETTPEDIAIANHLMKEVLLTKSDELPKAIRQFFEQLKQWLKTQNQTSFYSKALRSHFRMYPMKASRYITTLEQYGYLKKCGGNRKHGYEYEVTDWQEYEHLKAGVSIPDQLLADLQKNNREKNSGKYNRSVTEV